MAKGVKTHGLDEIDIMDLRAVKAVAEHRTMAAAAKVLGVTQPLVSYRIQLIENYFQQPVYHRATRKGEYLTPFGRMLYEYADAILDTYAEMITLARSFKK